MAASQPAPGEATHPALGLANTLQLVPAGPLDLITDPASASRWLLARQLLPADAALGLPCTMRLRGLRAEIRALLTSHTRGTPPAPQAVQAINTALTASPIAALLAWEPDRGLHISATHPMDRATDHLLALLAKDAVDLLTGDDAEKLAACGAAHCSRFLVRTHAARQWCSVRCGDRVRAARAYARRTGKQVTPSG